jgi:hypothetical protein
MNDLKVPMSPAGIPEPANWAMMMIGIGVVGAQMRRRNAMVTAKARTA